MTKIGATSPVLVSKHDALTPGRIARSALAAEGRVADLADFHQWLAGFGLRAFTEVERIPLDDLEGWSSDPVTGDIRHHSGRFFTIEGLEVSVPDGPVTGWEQPIINQPEIGILGVLVKEFGGVLHFLMQAKVEPGNVNGLQLSPTVQATRSNYSGVHRGRAVPYLEYFRDTSRHRVIADVRQSEQGSWFLRKRNRNMVVEVAGDVEPRDGFCWLTLGQLHRLLAVHDLVNADARTVLACLPFAGADAVKAYGQDGGGFRAALARSCGEEEGGLHSMDELQSWITEVRARTEIRSRRVPLGQVRHWHRSADRISHDTGKFFDVIGVKVAAGGREVNGWTQPMIEPHGAGVNAFLVMEISGVLHALVQARAEPGLVDSVELAPTVQCTPENYEHLPAAAWPRYLDEIVQAGPDRVRFDTTFSEEGGRFFHARGRYVIVETRDARLEPSDDFRWVAVHQLVDLLRHSHYLNIQARSLVACLHSLMTAPG
ncbi:NDP-hexose 2,3-dehydratase family protein [Spirillospora sp. NPDC047279]|uniref:NDP-hexose 2,3-dehydratase family protein n=1 Tax=Spirillospora sp. NPDC047279 TaxID=3155478 RepID=UPI0033DF9A2E